VSGQNASSGSISRLSLQFAGRSCLNPTALRHEKGEQKSNRESLRLETAVTQRKQRIEISSNREAEALFSSAKSLQITIRTDRGLPNPPAPYHQQGEQNSNRESHQPETAANQNSSNRKSERPSWDSLAGTPTSGVAGAASEAPLRGKSNGEVNGNGGAENRAGRNVTARPYNGNGERQKHIKTPSIFVSVRKISVVCFV
jgi:hypothetical protein